MAACEKCWRDANQRALLLGGSVSDHYRALLDERRANPCSQEAVEEPRTLDAVDPVLANSHEPTTRDKSI
jgi:hypothetical protein